MRTFEQILKEANELTSFEEKALLYFMLKEGVLEHVSSATKSYIESNMFDGILGKQEGNILPGVLNTKDESK